MIRRYMAAAALALGCMPLFAQSSATIIDPSRAADWTPNLFAIPAYTVPCSTQPTLVANAPASAAANASSIVAALTSCDASHNVVNVPAGTYYVNTVKNPNKSFTVLRGGGPQSTTIIWESTAGCVGGIGNQGYCMYDAANAIYNGNPAALPPSGTQQCTWGSGYAQGSTTIGLTGCGGTPPNGKILIMDQADDATDTAGVLNCQQVASTPTPTLCNNDGTGNENGRVISGKGHSQQQVTKITSVTSLGGGAFTITISPGVYFTNIRTGQTPGVWWPGFVQSEGIENMTVDGSLLDGGTIGMGQCYQCWIQNVISLSAARNHFGLYMSLQPLIQNVYYYQAKTHGSSSYGTEFEETSMGVVQNYIAQQTVAPIMFGSGTGNVVGYGFDVNNYYTGNGSTPPDVLEASAISHNSGNGMNLVEGHVGQAWWADNVWGSSAQDTFFRNALSGYQIKFPGGSTTCGSTVSGNCEQTPAIIRAWNRDMNWVANILGQPGYSVTYEMYATSLTAGTTGSEDNSIFSLGWATGGFGGTSNGGCSPTGCDPLSRSTLMRWDNYDAVNKTIRQNSTEGCPASNTYVNANCTNFTTPSTTLPASFYLSSKPSWWPSAKPFPGIGPDITTGNVSTCSGGTYTTARATSSAQCTGGTLAAASSTTAAWASHVISNPAMDCYFSLGGPPDGSGGVLAFDANTCYPSTSGGTSGSINGPTGFFGNYAKQ